MGRGDNRRTKKMRRKKSRRRLKDRIKSKIEAGKSGSTKKKEEPKQD